MMEHSWVQHFGISPELFCHETGTRDDNCGMSSTFCISKPTFNPYLLSIVSHYSVPLLSKNNAINVPSNV